MKKREIYKDIIIGGAIIGLSFGATGCSFNSNNPVSIGKQALEDMDAGHMKALTDLYAPSYRDAMSKNAKIQAMLANASADMAKHGKIVSIKVSKKIINKTSASVSYIVKYSDGHIDYDNNMDFVKINGKWYLSAN